MQERSEAERRAIWPCLNVATWRRERSDRAMQQIQWNSIAFHSIPSIRSKGSTSVLSTRKTRPIFSHPSLSSKGLFPSPRVSFGGQLNLSGASIVTAGVSGGNMEQFASGGCCVNCAPVRTWRFVSGCGVCGFALGGSCAYSGLVRWFTGDRFSALLRVFKGWMVRVVPGMWSTTILSNFRFFLRNFRFQRVTLLDPSTLTAYWSNCFTSITKPVRSHRSGWLRVWFWIKTQSPTLRGSNRTVFSLSDSSLSFLISPRCQLSRTPSSGS